MYDLAVVGAGIVGLAHAYAAARAGLKVVVIDREARSVGASVRNFGLVTVTGQGRGQTWTRAARSRDIWAHVAKAAGIPVLQEGLFLTARRPEALAVLEAYARTEEGAACRMIGADEATRTFPMLKKEGLLGGLWSPHEIRVEPREVIPRFTEWLEKKHGVTVLRPVHVCEAMPPRLETSAGSIEAGRIVLCPGDELRTLCADVLAVHGVTRTKLHMLRWPAPGWRSPAAFMGDLTLVRYEGFASLPEARDLRRRLDRECAGALQAGIHVIVTQSADGSLVIGDSHHDGDPPSPFHAEDVDAAILVQTRAFLDVPAGAPVERWTGTYAKRPGGDALVLAPAPDLRLALVTSGTGMSTAFALAEEVVRDLTGADVPDV